MQSAGLNVLPPSFYESDDNESDGDSRGRGDVRCGGGARVPGPAAVPQPRDLTLPPRKCTTTRPLFSKRFKSAKDRPKPLDMENERYYEHIFPREGGDRTHYRPRSLDHAEL